MSTRQINIDANGPAAVIAPTPARVGLNDTVIWNVSPATAGATITFRHPTHVRMSRATATKDQPAQGVVLSKPQQNENLIYDVVVSDPSWPADKPATAELIIAVEISNLNTES